jgi:hypothetical protein
MNTFEADNLIVWVVDQTTQQKIAKLKTMIEDLDPQTQNELNEYILWLLDSSQNNV